MLAWTSTIRAESVDELELLVSLGFSVLGQAAFELEKAVTTVTPEQGVQNVVNVLGGEVVAVQTHQPIVQNIGSGRSCVHGKMTAIQGAGKDGKPYKGYFCPQAKGSFDKCKNQYIFPTAPEWNTFVPDKLA